VLKEILKLISEGRDLREIEESLNLSSSLLTAIIQDLERRGYLEKARFDERFCSRCPLYSICKEKSNRSSVIYHLTEKGLKVIER